MADSVEKVYARALLEIAAEDNIAKELNEELSALSEISAANPELCGILDAPTVTDKEKFEFLESVFKGRISDISYNFLSVLTQKGRFKYLLAIAECCRKDRDEICVFADNGSSLEGRSKAEAHFEA